MVTRLIAGLVVLLVGGAGLYFFMESREADDAGLLNPGNPQLVATGAEIYATHCAGCHGAGGEGQAGWENATQDAPLAPPHNGTGHTWEHPDGALFDLTKTGLSTVACRTLDSEAMPQFDEILSDDQIVAVLSYIKTLWPDHIREQNVAINAIYADQDKPRSN
jgi:mono/diheme cytochrome c family protein